MSKINQLIKEWPRGAVMTIKHLQKKGVDCELIKRYKKSGWIRAVGRGAYQLAGDQIDWQGSLYALQIQLNLHVQAGGRTALELKGYGHYISKRQRTIYLYGMPGEQLPQWFKKYLMQFDYIYIQTNLFPPDFQESFTEIKHKDFLIRISPPERAAMEMLYHIPGNQGFDEAMRIMENLATLRPQILQNMLEVCRSIKVKRLFLYMAEKQNHFWFEQLNLKKINLGRGKRVIIKNGMLDKKYQITIPRESQYS
jgi:hypothetical protein